MSQSLLHIISSLDLNRSQLRCREGWHIPGQQHRDGWAMSLSLPVCVLSHSTYHPPPPTAMSLPAPTGLSAKKGPHYPTAQMLGWKTTCCFNTVGSKITHSLSNSDCLPRSNCMHYFIALLKLRNKINILWSTLNQFSDGWTCSKVVINILLVFSAREDFSKSPYTHAHKQHHFNVSVALTHFVLFEFCLIWKWFKFKKE